jgi:hypothetical protein
MARNSHKIAKIQLIAKLFFSRKWLSKIATFAKNGPKKGHLATLEKSFRLSKHPLNSKFFLSLKLLFEQWKLLRTKLST